MESKYTEYEEVLLKSRNFNLWAAIIFAFVFFCLILYTIKLQDWKLTSTVCILGILLTTTLYITRVVPYQKDIDEKSYNVYEGEFHIEQIQYRNKGPTHVYIKFPNENDSKRYELPPNISIQTQKTYSGIIVIAKNSNVLLEIINLEFDPSY